MKCRKVFFECGGVILLFSCSGGSGGVAIPPGEVRVSSVIPADGARGVPLDASVLVEFAQPVEPSTVTTSSFLLSSESSQVAGTVSSDGKRATLTPSQPLGSGLDYTISLRSEIRDTEGRGIQEFISRFRTADTVAPSVVRVSPPDGTRNASVYTVVDVVFSEPIDPGSAEPDSLVLTGPSGKVPATLSVEGSKVVLVPDRSLEQSSLFTGSLAVGKVKDMDGNPNEKELSWTFTTTEIVSPFVISRIPDFDDDFGDQSEPIKVCFSEPMAPGSIHLDSFYVLNKSGERVPGTVTYDPSHSTARFFPSSAPIQQASYEGRLTSEILDLAGNRLAGEEKAWRFRFGERPCATPATIETQPETFLSSSLKLGVNETVAFALLRGAPPGGVNSLYALRRDRSSGWGPLVSLESGTEAVQAADLAVVRGAQDAAFTVFKQKPASGNPSAIYSARFIGGAWQSAVVVAQDSVLDIDQPRIAMGPTGDAVAVFRRKKDGGSTTPQSLFAAYFSTELSYWFPSPLTALPLETDEAAGSDVDDLGIAMEESGVAIAIWKQKTTGASKLRLYAARRNLMEATEHGYDVLWGPPTRLDVYDSGDVQGASIAGAGNENFVVAWLQQLTPGGNFALFSSRFTQAARGWQASPDLLGTDVVGSTKVSLTTAAPSVAIDQTGNICIVGIRKISETSAGQVFAIRYSPDTGGWDPAGLMLVSKGAGDARNARVSLGPGGQAYVVWEQLADTNRDGILDSATDRYRAFARRLPPGGIPGPRECALNSSDSENAQNPVIGVGMGGMPTAAWLQTTPGSSSGDLWGSEPNP